VIQGSFLTKSAATAMMFTSVWVNFGWPPLVIFYHLHFISESWIPPKNILSVHSLIPITLFHQYYCFCHRQTGFETTFYGNSLFPPSMTYRENWLHKTSYNLYNVKDKQTKLCVWTDDNW
jgi:hypothetical protein